MEPEESVSVSLDPQDLSPLEQWQLFLRRLLPGSRRPMLAWILRYTLLTLFLGSIGYFIGRESRSETLTPGRLALFSAAVGLGFPIRLYRYQKRFIRLLSGVSPIELEVSRSGAELRSRDRVTKIGWAGVAGILVTDSEIVLTFRAGDVFSFPRSALPDPSREGRFLELIRSSLAGAADRPPSTA